MACWWFSFFLGQPELYITHEQSYNHRERYLPNLVELQATHPLGFDERPI
jgi:hypothetical protein